MKPQSVNLVVASFIACALCLSLSACGQAKSQTNSKNDLKEVRKARSFDDVLEDLDRSSVRLEQDLKQQIQTLPSIDAAKIRSEVEQALKQVDVAKLRTEMEASVAKIDWDKMKAELAKIKEIELPNIEAEMKSIRPQLEHSLKDAKASLEKAKVEIKEYQAFEEGLQKDGLINKEDYTIEHKDGALKINGNVQPADVYNKYKTFLQKHKSFTLRKNDKDFDIHN